MFKYPQRFTREDQCFLGEERNSFGKPFWMERPVETLPKNSNRAFTPLQPGKGWGGKPTTRILLTTRCR